MRAFVVLLGLVGLAFISRSIEARPLPIPPAPPDNIFGTPPPKHIETWIRISVLGLRAHPFPILWLSPRTFERSYFEKLIVLSPEEYRGVVSLARSYPCLDPWAKFPEDVAVFVTEHSRTLVGRGCRLPSTTQCKFLSNLSELPSIRHVAKDEDFVRNFGMSVGCPRS
jgi:hypothetical protein